jgi:hypothetical protein
MNDTDDRPADLIRSVHVDRRRLTVDLKDGRTISVPLRFYPALRGASDADRTNCYPIGGGHGIEWPTLDYHVSAAGIAAGRREGRWYAPWRKKHPVGSELVIEDGRYSPKKSHGPRPTKRRARRKSAARKASVARRKTKRG